MPPILPIDNYPSPFSNLPLEQLNNPYFISFASASAALSTVVLYKRFLRRIPNVDYVTPKALNGRRLRGVVTR